MELFNFFKSIARSLLPIDYQDWWIEITTIDPVCTYYFGDFSSLSTAQTALPGYIEDLKDEGAQGIQVSIKRYNPDKLTICQEEEHYSV